jgi:hypothetical protein
VFLFGYRPRSIVGSGYSLSISAGGSWRPYLLVFRVWLIRSLTPPKTELPATIANRRPKLEKYRGNFGAQRGARTHDPEIKSLMLYRPRYHVPPPSFFCPQGRPFLNISTLSIHFSTKSVRRRQLHSHSISRKNHGC